MKMKATTHTKTLNKIFNDGYFNPTQSEIREHWKPLVEAAGLYRGLPSATELYSLATLIMGDEIVDQRANAIAMAQAGLVSTPENYPSAMAVRAMTDEERTALQERIFARIRKDKISAAK
jgi:hypothetical protein